MQNDLIGISNLFKKYLPHFFKIFNPTENDLKRIYDVFFKWENAMRKMFIENNYSDILTSISIPEIIHKIESGYDYESSKAFLDFIDLQCEELSNKLDNQKLKMVRKNILKPMIYNCQVKPNESRFATALAELAVLNKLIDEKTIILNNCEFKLENGKKIDFLFTVNGKNICVEVYNLMNVKPGLIEEEDNLEIYFEAKIEKKLDDKLQNLIKEKPKFGFALQIVIWGGIDKLRKYDTFFSSFDKKYDIILPISLLGPYREEKTNKLVYIFQPVSERFNYIENFENAK
jgi:hypothetical protein